MELLVDLLEDLPLPLEIGIYAIEQLLLLLQQAHHAAILLLFGEFLAEPLSNRPAFFPLRLLVVAAAGGLQGILLLEADTFLAGELLRLEEGGGLGWEGGWGWGEGGGEGPEFLSELVEFIDAVIV